MNRKIILSAGVAALLVLGGAGCTVRVSTATFVPASSVRSTGSISVDRVRYLPAEKKTLDPNAFEFNKAGRVLFDIPLADQFKRGVVKELESSGFKIGPGGASLEIDIKRWHLADRFTSLELYVETTWILTAGGKSVSKDLRAARRHLIYSDSKKAEDVNAEITESYENFFSDPEVKALIQAVQASGGTPKPATPPTPSTFSSTPSSPGKE